VILSVGHLLPDPDTLDSMNNLANVLFSQGKYKEAEQMHRQTLELIETVLGRKHPSTLKNGRILAECLRTTYKRGEPGSSQG